MRASSLCCSGGYAPRGPTFQKAPGLPSDACAFALPFLCLGKPRAASSGPRLLLSLVMLRPLGRLSRAPRLCRYPDLCFHTAWCSRHAPLQRMVIAWFHVRFRSGLRTP